MQLSLLVPVAALLCRVTAHYELSYPGWRADSFVAPLSQWDYPCAGANETSNRTDWPIDGGSIRLDLHHEWTYVFLNLGVGNNISNFNVSLSSGHLLNSTGQGTLCWDKFDLPTGLDIEDGTNGTIQIVTSGSSGSALYNCADITFRKDAQLLPNDQCQNSTGLTVADVNDEEANSDNSTDGNKKDSSKDKDSAAAPQSVLAASLVLVAAGVVGGLLM